MQPGLVLSVSVHIPLNGSSLKYVKHPMVAWKAKYFFFVIIIKMILSSTATSPGWISLFFQHFRSAFLRLTLPFVAKTLKKTDPPGADERVFVERHGIVKKKENVKGEGGWLKQSENGNKGKSGYTTERLRRVCPWRGLLSPAAKITRQELSPKVLLIAGKSHLVPQREHPAPRGTTFHFQLFLKCAF